MSFWGIMQKVKSATLLPHTSLTLCNGEKITKGTATVTLERSKSAIILRDVPADVCANCGEYYLDDKTAQKVYELAESAVQRGAEVEILRFAA